MNERVDIRYVPAVYDDGRKTCVVSVYLDGSPMFDADGPTFEWALLEVIEKIMLYMAEADGNQT